MGKGHDKGSFSMTFIRVLWLVLSLAICAPLSASADQDGYLDPEKAFVMRAEMSGTDVVVLNFNIAPGYYMYRDRFSFTVASGEIKLGNAVFPAGQIKFDKTFNQEMELYFNALKIQVPLIITTPGAGSERTAPINMTVTGQGCAQAGLCYPPMDFVVKLIPSADGMSYTVNQPHKSLMTRLAEGQLSEILFGGHDEGLANLLSASGLLELTLLFFVLGLLLALTPCVLPMVPILSVLLVGEQHHVSRSRGLLLAAAYVAGMSVVYTALGVAAGLSGAGLAAWLQTPWVLAGFSVLLAMLALAMFDVYQFQMPSSIQTRLTVANSHILGGRMRAAWMMGALSALIVGPCVAAPLAGALLYISQTGDVVLGGTVLFAMAWGMGVPLLLMGASAGKLMPRSGPWMEGVKKFFGILLFATAWWMVMPLLSTWMQILGWAVLAMLAAMLLRPFDPLPQGAGFTGVLRKTLGMLLVLISAVWIVAVASGGRSLLQPLSHLARVKPSEAMTVPLARQSADKLPGSGVKQQLLGAKANANANASSLDVGHPVFLRVKNVADLDAMITQSKKPVMLDFYADWCVSCKEMEAFTFVDPAVTRKMNQMLLLQADVTANNAEDRALLKRFRLFGPPGIIFFEPGGQERRDVRVVGFQDATRFASTLDRILK
jgi:thiol:disulfide interchange protein DsbD